MSFQGTVRLADRVVFSFFWRFNAAVESDRGGQRAHYKETYASDDEADA